MSWKKLLPPHMTNPERNTDCQMPTQDHYDRLSIPDDWILTCKWRNVAHTIDRFSCYLGRVGWLIRIHDWSTWKYSQTSDNPLLYGFRDDQGCLVVSLLDSIAIVLKKNKWTISLTSEINKCTVATKMPIENRRGYRPGYDGFFEWTVQQYITTLSWNAFERGLLRSQEFVSRNK